MKKFLVMILGIIVFFTIVEVFLRLFGFVFLLNSEKGKIVKPKVSGVQRIMCLGDSTTALGGVDSYPYQLEEILNNSGLKVKFEVINKGEILVDTKQILRNLNNNIYKYDPDWIIVMAGINDNYKMAFGSSYKLQIFFNNLKIYRFLVLFFENLKQRQKIKRINSEFAQESNQSNWENQMLERSKNDNNNAQNYLELGTYYKNLGKFDLAIEYFSKVLDIVKDNYIPYFLMGVTYFDNKSYDKAIEILQKSINFNPKHVISYMYLGFCYKQKGDFLEAIKILELGLKLNKNNYELYSEIGFCYKEIKNYEKAEVMLLKSIIYLPNYFWAYSELVDIYKIKKEYSKAEEVLKKYIKMHPDDDKGYRELSNIYSFKGLINLAEEFSKKAEISNNKKYNILTKNNFLEMKNLADNFGLKIIFMQYPLRYSGPLKDIFNQTKDVEIIDNEKTFKNAISDNKFSDYFVDIFAGDFGHCTAKGNRIIAENVSKVILRKIRKEN